MVDVAGKLQKKRVLFLDGDGTLWYPRQTKRLVAPHWIYRSVFKTGTYLDYLMLVPGTVRVLKYFKKAGMMIILLSTHPIAGVDGDRSLRKTTDYFGLGTYIDESYSTEPTHEAKGEYMLKPLKRLKIPKSQAVMIGDNYFYDYWSARNVGIDAYLIDSSYRYRPKGGVRRLVDSLEAIINLVTL